MPLKKFNSNDEKLIKDTINENIASSMKTQPSFAKLLQLNGCSSLKLGLMGRKIRKQLLKEAESGYLTVESVMPRAYSLMGEYLQINEVKTFEELEIGNSISNIENDTYEIVNTEEKIDTILQKGFNATLPYISSGVRLGQAGGNSFGGATYVSSQFGEGQTEWKNSMVFFVENGLRIDETEQFIHYKQVDYVDYSEKEDRKGLFAFKRKGITFIMKNGEQIIMRVLADELNAIKYLIDANMENNKKTNIVENRDNNEDILIKYFDMFEKGLITREEFQLKKEQLFENNNSDNSLLKSKQQQLYCTKCGSLIDTDSNFCSSCGNQLKQ